MRRNARLIHYLFAAAFIAMAGCNQGSQLWPQQASVWQQQQQANGLMQSEGPRLGQLDADNRDLQTKLAQARQREKILEEQLRLTKSQLADTAELAKQLTDAKNEAEERADGILASTQRRGGATITANNSFTQAVRPVQIAGLDVRQDGDLIRVALPADQLFRPNSSQLQSGGIQLLDQVAQTIQNQYSRQHIGIEGHTDDQPLYGGMTNHALSSQQTLAVLEQLTSRNRLPAKQLMTTAHGSNYPREANSTPAGRAKNRRIEIVVYPETVDG